MIFFKPIQRNTPEERHILFYSVCISLLLLVIDQVTKWYFVRNYRLGESRELISGILNFTYVHNLGAAWSLLSGHVWLLLVFGLCAGVAVICFFRKLADGYAEKYFALTMILSGIAGNSFDRGFHGSVVDFIHVHYYEVWHYPVFNVADMAICTGVGIYIISEFFRKKNKKGND